MSPSVHLACSERDYPRYEGTRNEMYPCASLMHQQKVGRCHLLLLWVLIEGWPPSWPLEFHSSNPPTYVSTTLPWVAPKVPCRFPHLLAERT